MQLNRFTDYSIRVLLYAVANDSRRVTMSEISNYYRVSTEHMRKVVHHLSKQGYIDTYRGKNGGFKLAEGVRSVGIGEIIKVCEGINDIIDCSAQKCCLSPDCRLKHALDRAQTAFFDTLNEYTLDDLINNDYMTSILVTPLPAPEKIENIQ